MICTGATLKSPKYTIGCNLQVMMYQSPVSNSRCFMEFWDIGASPKFEDSRRMFYKKIQGLILVYDLTNIKSRINLGRWIHEISESLSKEDRTIMESRDSTRLQVLDRMYAFPFPVIVIGNKQDLVTRTTQDEEMNNPCHLELSAYDPSCLLAGGGFQGPFGKFLQNVAEQSNHREYHQSDPSGIFIDIRDTSVPSTHSSPYLSVSHVKND
eukprot:TRINITY_DN3604_c0_g1_i2.p1 TRINITY_DN3604_c0_g1~~TRINITY_DN3604_c0_g1_i2.p1  ORF type:complete len:211 (-),score=39.61 TRINITY_DN3604_c0_g1_i2:141-773(-)